MRKCKEIFNTGVFIVLREGENSAKVTLPLHPVGVKLWAKSCFPDGVAFPVGFTGVICMITVTGLGLINRCY